MTNKEAIANLNHIYRMVAPDIQRSLDVAIKCMEERPQGEWIRLDLAKRVIAKFEGYLDDDMIARIQIALEKESEAENER